MLFVPVLLMILYLICMYYMTLSPQITNHPLVVHVYIGNANVDVDNCMENQDFGQNAIKASTHNESK